MSLLLALHATCHQWRLRGMESGNGTAGNGDKHEGPDWCSLRMHVIEAVPDLWDLILWFRHNTENNTHCHRNQAKSEDRIDASDDGID